MNRKVWVLIHRYAGLAMTLFLIIVGLTGSLLAFYSELDRLVSPQLVVKEQNLPLLNYAQLVELAEQRVPQAQVNAISRDVGVVYVEMAPKQNPANGKAYELGFSQLILNPYTGEELGRRTWGAISEGLINLMPFIYKLHYNLALDDTGMWILGITALIWTLDSFVGFYLTLPTTVAKSSRFESRPSWWQRWRKAWGIKWRGSNFRITFDLHRAGGLWLWILLIIFAWSSVYMNLWDTVYTKVIQTFMEYHEPWTDIPKLPQPLEMPKLTWVQAEQSGAQFMQNAASAYHFEIRQAQSLWIDRELGVYVYAVRSSLDVQDKGGLTRVFVDANTGEQRLLLLPSQQYVGNTVTSWLTALHMANVFGLPFRILVCILGLVIVMLSVTGVIIWVKKRKANSLKNNQLVHKVLYVSNKPNRL